jgi:hypothetical protein
LNATSTRVIVNQAILSVLNTEKDLVLTVGSSFSTSFYIVDSVSGVAVPNPNYKVNIMVYSFH